MLIYHYSNKDFKGYIKPSFFGANVYSKNSERLSGVNRAYFYLDNKNKEYYFEGVKFCYVAEVNKKMLYDLNKDCKNIVKNLRNSQDIHKEVKKRGYIGLIGSNGFKCAVLFNNVKIIKRKVLQSEIF